MEAEEVVQLLFMARMDGCFNILDERITGELFKMERAAFVGNILLGVDYSCEELPFAPHLVIMYVLTECSNQLLGAEEEYNVAVRKRSEFAVASLFWPPCSNARLEMIDKQQKIVLD